MLSGCDPGLTCSVLPVPGLVEGGGERSSGLRACGVREEDRLGADRIPAEPGRRQLHRQPAEPDRGTTALNANNQAAA